MNPDDSSVEMRHDFIVSSWLILVGTLMAGVALGVFITSGIEPAVAPLVLAALSIGWGQREYGGSRAI